MSSSAGVSAARLVHEANQKAVNEALTKLKLAKAAWRVSGLALEREVAKAERAKLDKLSPPKLKATVPKMTKAIGKKAKVCKPLVPAKRGRPSSGECNACKRLLLGLKGGKRHICGRVPSSRIG